MLILTKERETLERAFEDYPLRPFVLASATRQHSNKNAKSSETLIKELTKINATGTISNDNDEQSLKIWRKHTLSVCLAPIKFPSLLGQAYAERSLLLARCIGKYDDSLMDADRAIETVLGAGAYHEAKLLCAKAALGILSSNEKKKTLERAKLLCSERIGDDDERRIIVEEIGRIERDDEMIGGRVVKQRFRYHQDVDSAVIVKRDYDTKNSSVKRYYLTIDRDIQPGEIIFTEKPYATAPNVSRHEPICGHCFAVCWSPLACDACTAYIYCSEICKNEAWKLYHNYECIVMDYCFWSRFYDYFPIVVRLLIRGYREAGCSIEEMRRRMEQRIVSVGEPDVSDGLIGILNLCDDASIDVTEIHKIVALQIITALARRTTFFGIRYSENDACQLDNDVNVVFVGSLILKLINICEICKIKAHDKTIDLLSTCSFVKVSQSYVSVSLARKFSLINHSCDPNVEACFGADNKIIVYALRPIKKNDQIFRSYISNNFTAVNHNRGSYLMTNFNFVCQCEACEGNWPVLTFPSITTKVKGLNGFVDSLCRNQFEKDLFARNKDVLTDILKRNVDKNTVYDKNTILNLSRSICLANDKLPRYSDVYRFLILALNFVFNKLYGID